MAARSWIAWLVARGRRPQLFHRLLDSERSRPLARRKLLEAHQVLADDRLCRDEHERVFDEPFDVVAGLVIGSLERIRTKIEELGRAKRKHGLHPDTEPVRLLFHENGFVLIVAEPGEIAVIGPIEEFATFAGAFAVEEVALIIAVEVDFETFACRIVALQQLALDL